MNIIIPMAGEGSRFREAGYTLPKPLIDVCGKPMIQRVVESLTYDAEYIFVIRKDHDLEFDLQNRLKNIVPDCTVIVIDRPTGGAACTVMLAETKISPFSEMIIANCDQYIEWTLDDFLLQMRLNSCVAGIPYFNSTNPHHSYIKRDEQGNVCDIVEKKVISDNAVVGIYWVKKATDFFWAAKRMIASDDRINNEFYISPVFKYLLSLTPCIGSYEIDVHKKHMLGTPNELEIFIDKVNRKEVKL
jgi:NDP-sugar pyrophosphorylase family protein